MPDTTYYSGEDVNLIIYRSLRGTSVNATSPFFECKASYFSFSKSQQKVPIYGHKSVDPDSVALGEFVIQGTLAMTLTDLTLMLDKLGITDLDNSIELDLAFEIQHQATSMGRLMAIRMQGSSLTSNTVGAPQLVVYTFIAPVQSPFNRKRMLTHPSIPVIASDEDLVENINTSEPGDLPDYAWEAPLRRPDSIEEMEEDPVLFASNQYNVTGSVYSFHTGEFTWIDATDFLSNVTEQNMGLSHMVYLTALNYQTQQSQPNTRSIMRVTKIKAQGHFKTSAKQTILVSITWPSKQNRRWYIVVFDWDTETQTVEEIPIHIVRVIKEELLNE